MENKYKITITYNDKTVSQHIGVGRPKQTLTELMIESPDGAEIVILKDNVKSFVVRRLNQQNQ